MESDIRWGLKDPESGEEAQTVGRSALGEKQRTPKTTNLPFTKNGRMSRMQNVDFKVRRRFPRLLQSGASGPFIAF